MRWCCGTARRCASSTSSICGDHLCLCWLAWTVCPPTSLWEALSSSRSLFLSLSMPMEVRQSACACLYWSGLRSTSQTLICVELRHGLGGLQKACAVLWLLLGFALSSAKT